ncbi:MAG: hypothetical protein II984_01360 [Clostridia bacterium]|nr:hypothetical protein [Clostridia bacterium]
MKKKIILICTLFLMCVFVFSLSASASKYDFILSDESVFASSAESSASGYFESVPYQLPSDSYYYDFNYFTYYSSSGDSCFAMQPAAFQEFVDYICSTNGTANFVDFQAACAVQNETFGTTFYELWINASNSFNEALFNKLYFYDEITDEDLQLKYTEGHTQGKIDGVAEFKTTEEYKGQYTTGYADGINNFKETELPEMLLLEREIGQAEGKDIYMASEEYSNVLEAEYDNGYEAASTEQDRKQMQNNLGAILGTCGVIVIALSVVYLVVSRKKRKRR